MFERMTRNECEGRLKYDAWCAKQRRKRRSADEKSIKRCQGSITWNGLASWSDETSLKHDRPDIHAQIAKWGKWLTCITQIVLHYIFARRSVHGCLCLVLSPLAHRAAQSASWRAGYLSDSLNAQSSTNRNEQDQRRSPVQAWHSKTREIQRPRLAVFLVELLGALLISYISPSVIY